MSYVIGFGLNDLTSMIPGMSGGSSSTPTKSAAAASTGGQVPDNRNYVSDVMAASPPSDPAPGSLLNASGYRMYNALLMLSDSGPLSATDAQNLNGLRQLRAGVPNQSLQSAMNPAGIQDVVQRAQAKMAHVSATMSVPGGGGLSTGAKIGIGVGVVGVAGLGYWYVTKK